jgi:hypothetical protein
LPSDVILYFRLRKLVVLEFDDWFRIASDPRMALANVLTGQQVMMEQRSRGFLLNKGDNWGVGVDRLNCSALKMSQLK